MYTSREDLNMPIDATRHEGGSQNRNNGHNQFPKIFYFEICGKKKKLNHVNLFLGLFMPGTGPKA